MGQRQMLLVRYDQMWQAEMMAHQLLRAGIPTTQYKGSREYLNIVMGGPQETTELYVDAEDFAKARRKLRDLQNEPQAAPFEEAPAKDHFRRVILFSLLGMTVLPFIFNWLAFLNLEPALRQNITFAQKVLAIVMLALGWMGAIGLILLLTGVLKF